MNISSYVQEKKSSVIYISPAQEVNSCMKETMCRCILSTCAKANFEKFSFFRTYVHKGAYTL